MAYTNYFKVHGQYRQGGITCAMPFGSLVGALASSFIADKYSRKIAIQIASIIWIIGSMSATLLYLTPKSADSYQVSKLLPMELAFYVLGASLPVFASYCFLCCARLPSRGQWNSNPRPLNRWLTEQKIAPKEIRGRVVSLQQWAITWGILVQYFIRYGASFVSGGPMSLHFHPTGIGGLTMPLKSFRCCWPPLDAARGLPMLSIMY